MKNMLIATVALAGLVACGAPANAATITPAEIFRLSGMVGHAGQQCRDAYLSNAEVIIAAHYGVDWARAHDAQVARWTMVGVKDFNGFSRKYGLAQSCTMAQEIAASAGF
jgi:hypothetical protein